MIFYLFPFFIPSLLRKFKAQFQENPDPNFEWFYYYNGSDHNATEKDFQAYLRYFVQSIYWAMGWFFLGIVLMIYVYLNPLEYPGNIFNYLYVVLGLVLYLGAVKIVKAAFVKAMDSELWTTNLSDKFGARPKIKLENPAKTWWKTNKAVIRYFGTYLSALIAVKIYVTGITPENKVVFIISVILLALLVIWVLVDLVIGQKKERKRQTLLLKEREGERQWEAYQRELDAKINPVKSKKKQQIALKKKGKVKLKKYKGETSNE